MDASVSWTESPAHQGKRGRQPNGNQTTNESPFPHHPIFFFLKRSQFAIQSKANKAHKDAYQLLPFNAPTFMKRGTITCARGQQRSSTLVDTLAVASIDCLPNRCPENPDG